MGGVRKRPVPGLLWFVLGPGLGWVGCANPGPPHAPSLQLPALVDDLKAERRAGAVELRFTLPERTSDGLLLRPGDVTGLLCRTVESGPCRALPQAHHWVTAGGKGQAVEVRDELPPELATGPARLLLYRVELANGKGRSAGYSEAAYAVAGSAPKVVSSLRAEGSRLGTLLRWAAESEADAQVVLRREDLGVSAANAETKARVVMLDAGTKGKAEAATLDVSAVVDEPYRYSAERQRAVQLGGRKLLLHSGMSGAVEFTLRDVFPPATPDGLTAAGYADGAEFSVDLIWQPVEDQKLAGYNVYRQAAGAAEWVRLTAQPVRVPAFHDAGVSAGVRYVYRVTAVDAKGNESGAAVTAVER